MTEKKLYKTDENEPKTNFLVGTRGRIFEGFVVKKFPKRVVIEYERTIYNHKYDRFFKKKSRIHARLPENVAVAIGDYIKVRECRPLSKIIHHLVIEKVDKVGNKK